MTVYESTAGRALRRHIAVLQEHTADSAGRCIVCSVESCPPRAAAWAEVSENDRPPLPRRTRGATPAGPASTLPGHEGAIRHAPKRPEWICTCGAAWPCEEKRREYRAEIADVGSLPVIAALTDHYYMAIQDRPDLPPRQLYEQIVQWVTA